MPYWCPEAKGIALPNHINGAERLNVRRSRPHTQEQKSAALPCIKRMALGHCR